MIDNGQKNFINILAFVLGVTSVIGQVLLLRELVSVFYGNETAYAIILSSWLFWVAIGSFCASKLTKAINRPFVFLSICQSVIFFVLPASILFARSIKVIMNIPTGELISIGSMTIISFILLAPLTFCLGAMFTLICSLLDVKNEEDKTVKVQGIYLYESLGAAIGGVLFTFVLVHLIPALHIAFILGAINIFILVLINKGRKRGSFGKTVLIVVVALILIGLSINKLDRISRAVQWRGFNVVNVADSIYGNIALVERNNHYSIYTNGLHLSTTGDDLTSEESVHFPLLVHPDPKSVLLIGNGITGGIKEILKHPQSKIHYVEIDPKVIKVAKEYLPKKDLSPLFSKKIFISHKDGRQFVKKGNSQYDVIIINLGDPTTALLNRYYSLEFFEEVNRILKEGGVLSLSVTSSENYLNEEARSFLRSIHTTLRKVFVDVKSIPGETNIFLACNKFNILTLDPDVLVQRLKDRNISTKFVREYYLPFKIAEERINYIDEVLKQEGQINTDTRPIAYLYDIILFSTHFNQGFKNFMDKIIWIKPKHLLPVLLFLLIVGFFVASKRPTFPISLSIATTGFSEIIFQVIVILAFQTLYGYAYYKIGLIIASFMFGLVLGSLWAKKLLRKELKKILTVYKWTQLSIVIYPLLLPLLFVIFRDFISVERNTQVFATVFAVLPVIAGTIGGLQYPLANHLMYYLNKNTLAARPAGFLYAADVFGAAIGALVTGAILIPLWGINQVAYVCAAINGVVLILLLNGKKVN